MKLSETQVARRWSNTELRRFAPLMAGDIVNVSAWQDLDKEGARYRDYFAARSYSITNFEDDARGWQGVEGEIFLDLTKPLPDELVGRFDVVLCHTVLEHVFDVWAAFANLCRLTRDAVVIVVPFRQKQHGSYGDFWRFTPQAIDRLFRLNGLATQYVSGNRDPTVYVFAIGARRDWPALHDADGNFAGRLYERDVYL